MCSQNHILGHCSAAHGCCGFVQAFEEYLDSLRQELCGDREWEELGGFQCDTQYHLHFSEHCRTKCQEPAQGIATNCDDFQRAMVAYMLCLEQNGCCVFYERYWYSVPILAQGISLCGFNYQLPSCSHILSPQLRAYLHQPRTPACPNSDFAVHAVGCGHTFNRQCALNLPCFLIAHHMRVFARKTDTVRLMFCAPQPHFTEVRNTQQEIAVLSFSTLGER